jgi:hypothetical protein
VSIGKKTRGSRGLCLSLSPKRLRNQIIDASFVISSVISRMIILKRGGIGSSFVLVIVESYEDGYESVGALVVTCWEPKKSWMFDLECSYHICLRNGYFETLDLK